MRALLCVVGLSFACADQAGTTLEQRCANYASAFCRGLERCASVTLRREYENLDNCGAVVEARCVAESAGGFGLADLRCTPA